VICCSSFCAVIFCVFAEVFASRLSGFAEVSEAWLVINRVILDFRLKIDGKFSKLVSGDEV
jgi:hypothetical protein